MAATLLKRCTCPHCWNSFAPEEILWVASHPELFGDPRLGANQYRRFLPSRFTLNGEAIDSRGQTCLELACPHCHLAVPRSLLEVEPLFASILGTPGCGKSYFLAAMTWELRKHLPQDFRVSFADADPKSNILLSQYQEALFLNPDGERLTPLSTLIEKTDDKGHLYNMVQYGEGNDVRYPRPFMFSISPLKEHPNVKESHRISRVLCLYDNAGENYLAKAGSSNQTETQHLGKAQFLMFLFDPTQDQRYRSKVQAVKGKSFVLPPARQIQRQEVVLVEAVSRIRRLTGQSSTTKYDRPLIVIVTKQDEWDFLIPNRDTTSCWVRAQQGFCVLDGAVIENQSQQIRGLLNQIAPEVVSSAESFSEKVCYIGVSALGVTPETVAAANSGWIDPAKANEPSVRPATIQPLNVMLPFLYGLGHSLSGVIPLKKRK